jgi:hypothetical protein
MLLNVDDGNGNTMDALKQEYKDIKITVKGEKDKVGIYDYFV